MNLKNFQFEEDPSAKNAQRMSKIHHELLNIDEVFTDSATSVKI